MKILACSLHGLGTMVWCALGWCSCVDASAAQSTTLLQVSTLAGGGPIGTDGTRSAAGFNEPSGIAVDRFGNVYVSDADRDMGMGNTIRKISPSGVVTTLAGAHGLSGGANGTGSTARFFVPEGLAVDDSGNIYVADSHNGTVRKVTSGGVVTTLASAFYYHVGVAVDGSGNVYVGDTYNHAIRKITPGGVVTTVAGAIGMSGSADGIGGTARFRYPQGVSVDASGDIYVADSGNSTVRKVTPDGVVTTLAGVAGNFGTADGVGNAARFAMFSPAGLAIDRSGSIYVADTGNNTIRKLTTTGEVTTVAGAAGFAGNADGTGDVARFYFPVGVAVDRDGVVYVADMGNNRIRVGVPVVAPVFLAQPTSQTMASGSTAVFGASTEGSPLPTYQWQKDGVDIYGATNAILIVTRATETDAGAYACVASNSSGSVTSSPATLAVVNTSNVGRLVNLSVRAIAGPGGQTLIVGFVVGGSGTSGSGNLLIRAVGPTLTTFGAAGALADPVLTVFQEGAIVASNDNWGTPASNQSAVLAADRMTGAFQFSNSLSLDAALVVKLPSFTGGYTAQIAGAGTGVTLAEVYDSTADYTAATPRLINFSARTRVGAGNDELIAGFVVGGSTSKTVLIRAIGPALVPLGVTTALQDPQLALHTTIGGKDTVLATNAGWGGDPQISAIGNYVGAFPLTNGSSADSAVLVSLPPGAYTIRVSGVSSDAGVAVAEIYDVP